jgi:hypothetical protein
MLICVNGPAEGVQVESCHSSITYPIYEEASWDREGMPRHHFREIQYDLFRFQFVDMVGSVQSTVYLDCLATRGHRLPTMLQAFVKYKEHFEVELRQLYGDFINTQLLREYCSKFDLVLSVRDLNRLQSGLAVTPRKKRSIDTTGFLFPELAY